MFEGVAKDIPDPFRKFRGYVAVDNIAVKQGLECKGHCTFEGGFCGWINDEDDDFNWSLVRRNNTHFSCMKSIPLFIILSVNGYTT